MRIFLLALVFITALETGVFWHYDNILKGQQSITASTSETGTKKKIETPILNKKLLAEEKVKLVSISENQRYVAYVSNNNRLHIIDIENNTELYSANEEDQMNYIKWIRSDNLFIGLKSEQNHLVLKTFQVGTHKERIITTFTGVTSTSTFKSISYSPYTNDVYTLIGNDTITKLYHFNTNGKMTNVPLRNSYIEKPTLLSTKNELFYEDKFHTIWLKQNSSVKNIESNATILSVYDDTIYYGKLDQDGYVTKIYSYQDGQKHLIDELPTPVSGDHILITEDENTLYIEDNVYYDMKQNKHFTLPKDSEVTVENHKFFLLTQNDTNLIKE
ncbi:hypothetical protein [Neobacillus citreus]|uniref:Dipeptidylpeptidase IV N-terminal domain-containing protein n=1 Tax=Neobacillus citreus TaxID=2833578 RepID=A0A942YBC7_9BACI|nr:hypothetical protein [Neobacillus citreus]MCH6266536.1 hypothetical protein [Neobacillus citreus]